MKHQEEINNVLQAMQGRTFDTIYLVACGGSMAALAPMEYFFDIETNIPTKVYTSNEFVHRIPARIDSNALVITRSHSGTTPETVEATKLARDKGAFTVAISMDSDSPLCQAAEKYVTYTYDKNVKFDRYEGDSAVFYRFVVSLLHWFTGDEKYSKVLRDLENIDTILNKNEKKFIEEAKKFGSKNKRKDIIYTMGSGVYYPEMYAWTSCLMMEMQWVNSNAIHSGEYFHGPFEITDYDVPFLIVRSNLETKPLDDRAISFAQKYSNEVYVIDTNDFEFMDAEEFSKRFISPIISTRILREYAEQLADHRGHPLSVRRYMWRMEY